MNSSKTLLAIVGIILFASAIFGVVNVKKVHELRADMAVATRQQQEADRRRLDLENEIKTREEKVAAQLASIADSDDHIAGAEADLVKIQTEKSDLQAKLQANETQIADLQKHIDELTKTPTNPNPGAPSAAELQAQLDEARKQLDGAEREKTLLADKFQRPAEQTRTKDVFPKRHEQSFRGSIHGTVLAVNHAYNFVVLNLGNRQGVEANAEMLVLRGGTLIGKIRISSVEPATAIGDILATSLTRGVQVQPGDTVIYAGSNS